LKGGAKGAQRGGYHDIGIKHNNHVTYDIILRLMSPASLASP
jgi:hypothetical protein